MKLPSTISQSLLAGTFILGIGTGVTVDSQIKEVKQCKDNMSNTWAFVGDLNDYP